MKIIKRTLIVFLFVILFSLGSLTILNVVGKLSADQVGFVSPKTTSRIDLNDGQIASFWSNINSYQDVTEFGENAFVKFANNGTHLFALLVSSSNNTWISVEFEPASSLCMKNLNDGWSFYINKDEETVIAKDVMFVGARIPDDDAKNDLFIESIFSEGLVYIETIRPFDTSDLNGYDISFHNASTNYLKFASNKNHFGAHKIFYLHIYIPVDSPGNETSGSFIIPDIPPPDGVDLSQVKFLLLGVTPVGVFGFVGIHLIRRVIYSPIKHDHDRIVSSSWKPPTLVERFKDTFLREE
ncbi:MAG: hypothetical protein ACXADY_20165 [Candidatus Hodarchaeales archaeon]|jgi:hypothetical protein